jgi:hypothetical protein
MIDPQISEKATWWLGETKGFWVQTGALLLSAVGALWIVFSRSRSERRRATVDLVLKHNEDEQLVQAKKDFLKILDGDDGNLARFLSHKESTEYDCIRKILNMHEFVCCGIRGKAYDEKLYKRMQCNVVVRDWDALAGFVQEFRKSKRSKLPSTDADTFYQDFERVAIRWKSRPLNKISKWWPFL